MSGMKSRIQISHFSFRQSVSGPSRRPKRTQAEENAPASPVFIIIILIEVREGGGQIEQRVEGCMGGRKMGVEI